MKRIIFNLIIGLLFVLNSSAAALQFVNNNDTVNDGPYIFKDYNKLKVKWIENGTLKEEVLTPDNFQELKKNFNLLFDYTDLTDTYQLKPNYTQVYTEVDSLSVISDIHGEFHSYLDLLKAAGIIDENLNWIYGKGHLVILGDSFDRGSMVTELLWHIFGLEKQAEKAGGMVHFLIGNHEFMVLNKDESYINDKYRTVEALSKISYSDLYSSNSVLGRWLRSKPVIMTINDVLFVHAGISIEMIDRKLKIEQINRAFSDMLLGKVTNSDREYEEHLFLIDSKGPVWYRGYFKEQYFSENMTDLILNFYDTKHIVVGHTHCEGINPIFKSKIFGIDAGISNNETGEMLIYKNGVFYRGLVTGERVEL